MGLFLTLTDRPITHLLFYFSPPDLVVQATLHRCAHTLQSTLDSEQILSQLNEEGILPPASAPSTHRLLPPDNPRRQANNILFWLRGVSRAQFERFIAIVRETGEGSRPHEELALKLEEEYGRLINDPGVGKL